MSQFAQRLAIAMSIETAKRQADVPARPPSHLTTSDQIAIDAAMAKRLRRQEKLRSQQ